MEKGCLKDSLEEKALFNKKTRKNLTSVNGLFLSCLQKNYLQFQPLQKITLRILGPSTSGGGGET